MVKHRIQPEMIILCLEMFKGSGVDTDDGVVRTSMVHYNSEDDVKKLINVLKKSN